MKERPILFSGPMVRAILEGRKTVTRRVIKPSMRSADVQFDVQQEADGSWHPYHTFDECRFDRSGSERPIVCPYGQPGDRLWVRETWSIEMLAGYSTDKGYESEYEIRYRADDGDRPIHVAASEPDPYLALYDSQQGEWRPSIHMPRLASRILLEVTAVRVERLHSITDQQAQAEGIERDSAMPTLWKRGPLHGDQNLVSVTNFPKLAFRSIWEAINGHESWAANPWVWVVEFKRVEAASV